MTLLPLEDGVSGSFGVRTRGLGWRKLTTWMKRTINKGIEVLFYECDDLEQNI